MDDCNAFIRTYVDARASVSPRAPPLVAFLSILGTQYGARVYRVGELTETRLEPLLFPVETISEHFSRVHPSPPARAPTRHVRIVRNAPPN